MRAATFRTPSALPGFGLAFGITMTMLSILVIIPDRRPAACGASTSAPPTSWKTIHTERVWASLRLSFRISLLAALFNLVFGLALAWVLARYRFPGKRLVDAAVDLPFALPTAVAGIALTALYAPNGAFGRCSRRSASRSPTRRSASGWRWSSSACPSWSARCSR